MTYFIRYFLNLEVYITFMLFFLSLNVSLPYTITNTHKYMNVSYLSIKEVAKRVRVDYQVIRLLVTRGDIKATKVGKQYRILESDLKEYLNINSNQKSQS